MTKIMICAAVVVPLFGMAGWFGGGDHWKTSEPVVAHVENMNIYEMELKTDVRHLDEERIASLF